MGDPEIVAGGGGGGGDGSFAGGGGGEGESIVTRRNESTTRKTSRSASETGSCFAYLSLRDLFAIDIKKQGGVTGRTRDTG